MKLVLATETNLYPKLKNVIGELLKSLGFAERVEFVLSKDIFPEKDTKLVSLGAATLKHLKGYVPFKKISDLEFRVFDMGGSPIYVGAAPTAILADSDAYVRLANILRFVLLNESREPPQCAYKVLSTQEELLALRWVVNGSIDLETTGLSFLTDKITHMGIYDADEGITYCISEKVLRENAKLLKDILEESNKTWVGTNFNQFDRLFLRQYDIQPAMSLDVMLMDYVLEEVSGQHSLDAIVAKHFGIPSWKNIDYTDVEEDVLLDYLAKDCTFTYQAGMYLLGKLSPVEKDLHNLLLESAKVLGNLTYDGLLVDIENLCVLDEVQQDEIGNIETELSKYTHYDFNSGSSVQVSTLLYKTLGLGQKPSIGASDNATDAISLANLQHPVADLILRARKYKQSHSTFVTSIMEKLTPESTIHMQYKLHGTVTGRLSCVQPNMMQMPRDVSDDALNIKRSFIPSSDSKTILEVDYSQLELRVAAWFSRDEFLLGIYNNNQDLHRMVAAQVNKVPVEEVTKPMRQAAKSISFGALYSIGPDKLAEQISVQSGIACSSTEAAQFLQNFYNSVPGFVLWARQQKYNALNNGFVETPLGRRRRFPYLGATHEVMRQAINAPIQSLASDICLTSLIACYNMIDHRVCKPIMTVHDSIVFEVETKEFDSVLPQIIEICTNKEGLLEYRVPFDVEYKSGPTYGDLKEK